MDSCHEHSRPAHAWAIPGSGGKLPVVSRTTFLAGRRIVHPAQAIGLHGLSRARVRSDSLLSNLRFHLPTPAHLGGVGRAAHFNSPSPAWDIAHLTETKKCEKSHINIRSTVVRMA